MAVIMFNSNVSNATEVLSYNRTTTYDSETSQLVSNAYMSLRPSANTATYLNQLMAGTIERITIKTATNGDIIYDLNNVGGRLTSVQESFSGGDHIDVYVNISATNAAETDDGD